MGFELDSRTQWGSISQIYNVLPAHGSIQFFVVFLNGKILSILFLPNRCKKKKAFWNLYIVLFRTQHVAWRLSIVIFIYKAEYEIALNYSSVRLK